MEIKGLKLPSLFLQDIDEIDRRSIRHVKLFSDTDAFGFNLDVDLIELHNRERIIRETNNLPKGFEPNGYYGEPNETDYRQNYPGFILDITDFSEIICFGDGGDASPFCFDYRNDSDNPSVIWWNDDHWRRIAPDYESFRTLLDVEKLD